MISIDVVGKGIHEVFTVLKKNIEELGLSKEIVKGVMYYLKDREDKTYELLRREQKIIELSRGVYRVEFKSRIAEEKRVESFAIVKDLSEQERIVKTGQVSVEQALWVSVVGVDSLKCNCPDSLFNIWRSIRGLALVDRKTTQILAEKGLFDKYNLCKHTLYTLGLAAGIHGLKLYKRHIEILKLEIIGVVLYTSFKHRGIGGHDREILKGYMEKINSMFE